MAGCEILGDVTLGRWLLILERLLVRCRGVVLWLEMLDRRLLIVHLRRLLVVETRVLIRLLRVGRRILVLLILWSILETRR